MKFSVLLRPTVLMDSRSSDIGALSSFSIDDSAVNSAAKCTTDSDVIRTSMTPRFGSARGSGPGMRLLEGGPQPVDRDVRVDLGGRHGLVAEQLLDAAQVGAAVEQVGGR